MSTLADSKVRNACYERLARLNLDAARKWGRMTVHQMVCHLNDSFLVGMGEKNASPVSNPFTRTVVKWIAIRTPLKWPHGVATRPEIEQGKGGTPPADWRRDCEELRRLIGVFAERETFGFHPIFGAMSRADWQTWGYRHVDHHFRQFGV